jgi:hypothetical protein
MISGVLQWPQVALNHTKHLGVSQQSTDLIRKFDIHDHWMVTNTVIMSFLFTLVNFINKCIL